MALSDSSSSNTKIHQYLNQLNDLEKKAHFIAKHHLGTSYNITKSNGYIEWLKKQDQTPPPKSPS